MKPMTDKHLAVLRRHMVEIIDLHYDLSSDEIGLEAPGPLLRKALLQVPRHMFVPQELIAVAYLDRPLPIGFDKTISQPFIGALMIDLLGLSAGDKVLEVGTGYGYQAAIMAAMGARVFSVEVVEEFSIMARDRLAALGQEVELRIGDGVRGWPEHAPFDAILVTAAADEPPVAIVEQIKPGGRIVMPLGGQDVQQLSVLEKQPGGELASTAIMPVRFTRLEQGP